LGVERPRRGPAWTLCAVLGLVLAGPVSAAEGLPRDFELSPVARGGFGGGETRADCGELLHHPVILVHGDTQGPESWRAGGDGGVVGALENAGFGPCEIWALEVGTASVPLRSLEELTDDVKVFIHAVLAYTGAPRVQVIAEGAGAVAVQASLRKYALHDLIHAVVYLDAPFGGLAGCSDERCFAGEVLCCALRPGSGFLHRTLLPLETPEGLSAVPDQGLDGHLRYLVFGSTAPVDLATRSAAHGSWMLDGAWNLSFPELSQRPLHQVPGAWSVALRALSDPAVACTRDRDGDGDGYCAARTGGNDCDDADPGIHPGATEIEADGIDQDCNRHDLDRRFVGWKCERPMADAGEPPPEVETAPMPPPRRDGLYVVTVGLLVGLGLAVPVGVVAFLRRRVRP
jgi:hypothetical protein